MCKEKENNYHFTGLRARLVEVGELKSPRPEHKVCSGTIQLINGRSGTDMLPVITFNKMAEALATKMRVGCVYDFSGFFLGNSGDGHKPGMNLHLCWSDRVATTGLPPGPDDVTAN